MDGTGGPLDALIVEKTSFDGMITARLSGRRNQVELRFQPGAYHRYSADELGAQLGQLASRVWVGYRRGYFAALSAARGETITGDEPVFSPREQQYRREQAELELTAVSPAGWVTLSSVGLVRWQVRIRPGFSHALDEYRFLAEVDAALRQLLDNYFDKVRQLQVEHFDLKLPEPQNRNQPRNGWR